MPAADVVLGLAATWWAYAYGGYPLTLALLGRRAPDSEPTPAPRSPAWPFVSICVPAYNESRTIADTLERLVSLDYPSDRREIVVVSDASTDGTDEIVARFARHGVVLRRLPKRVGKTEAENFVAEELRGSIIINTDASVIVDRGALRALVDALRDPTVGVASGVDVSVPSRGIDAATAGGERAYVGYEMTVRELEMRVAGLVGASGCLYATRPAIQRVRLPGGACRDFAVAMLARELGLRTVAARGALCFVPRTTSVAREYRRKARTIARGLGTMWLFRRMLNPWRHGVFAWMLWSHKVARWLAPAWAVVACGAIAWLAVDDVWARVALALGVCGAMGSVIGSRVAGADHLGLGARIAAAAAYFTASNLAVLAAWLRVMRGANHPTWEPTQRS